MKKQNGITLIALIITIIVMLILVGVTINVALNGGLFEKAKTATVQTEIAQIQEQLVLAKAEKIADNNGNLPSDYGITLSDLDLSEELKTKYSNKLTISKDGTLYYTENATANDIVYFENAGITLYQEQTRSDVEYYVVTFQDGSTIVELVDVIDYKNSKVKIYSGINGGNLTLGAEPDVTFVEPNFTIILDGVETQITNGIGIIAEGSTVDLYIKDKKLYEGNDGQFDSSAGYFSLDPNFDTSRLVEE